MRTAAFLGVAILVALAASPVHAQLRGDVVVSGLTLPLAFVQDPSAANVQYVVEQGGRIRVVQNGTLLATPFIDLSAVIAAGGERGLLGLAFAPDYAASGRFYVNFTNTAGDTVVARFKRSAGNPLVADPSTRFDLRWSTGERVIRQPFANHNGGNLVFGPDGFLYIGMGDGGSGNDPNHFAQTPSSLLGKMLRIDVNVPDGDPEGFNVPPTNPFLGGAVPGARPEIWDFGLRNPFRWSFDDPSRGGTGALVIGDVGQGAFEEIDYEPAGRGGRNYGWRNREGAHDNVTTLPPAFGPLVEPIFEYTHAAGQSITGGYVYRGQALGAAFRGRYFFADFVAGRVWSIALTIDGAGNAAASDLREHTAQLAPGNVSSFGVDAAGELYIVSYSAGRIIRIGAATPAVAPAMVLDAPRSGNVLRQPFLVAGWAVDRGATLDSGIDAVHVWAYPASGSAPVFVGAAQTGIARPDVAAALGGAQFGQSGYGLLGRGLPGGSYLLVAFALVHATGRFDVVATANVTIVGGGQMAVDAPQNNSIVTSPFVVGGWALDAGAASGTGIDVVHVWAYPVAPAPGPPTFVGAAVFGPRPDVAAFFGSQFLNSGYTVPGAVLPRGTWDLVVFCRSTVSGVFDTVQVVRVTVR
jgi:glucose/arabinose dehydrogenase